MEYLSIKIQLKLIVFLGKRIRNIIARKFYFINRDQITKISFKRRTFYIQLVKNLVSFICHTSQLFYKSEKSSSRSRLRLQKIKTDGTEILEI
jgi:predicted component of viral defense system (DUF524 family)